MIHLKTWKRIRKTPRFIVISTCLGYLIFSHIAQYTLPTLSGLSTCRKQKHHQWLTHKTLGGRMDAGIVSSEIEPRRLHSESAASDMRLRWGACGGRGIRTPGTVPRTAVFKTAGFNHSPIPPAFRSNSLPGSTLLKKPSGPLLVSLWSAETSKQIRKPGSILDFQSRVPGF